MSIRSMNAAQDTEYRCGAHLTAVRFFNRP